MYPARYVLVLRRSRSPATIVVPPVPTNCAWFVLHDPDVRDVKAMGPSAVEPSDLVIVSVTVDVTRPLGVDTINNVQFDWSPDLPTLTPSARTPVVQVTPETVAPLAVKRSKLNVVEAGNGVESPVSRSASPVPKT